MSTTATTTQRGYGSAHQRLRATLMAQLAANPGIPCPKCGRPMYVEQNPDLGHADDRTGYTGLEHRRCNRRAGAIKGNRKRGRRRAWIRAQTAGRW